MFAALRIQEEIARYAEKLRRAKHDIDEAAIKPYFQLDRMIAAAFETARRLFGLAFEEVTDLSGEHVERHQRGGEAGDLDQANRVRGQGFLRGRVQG